jgi:hypothetical protein
MLLYRKLVLYISLLCVCFIAAGPVWAAKVAGEFNAAHACPAYISKKISNLDNILLDPGKNYGVWDAIEPINPSGIELKCLLQAPNFAGLKQVVEALMEACNNQTLIQNVISPTSKIVICWY